MPPLPPIHCWENVQNPRAAIQILHGMAEHGARYARLADALNQAGYLVWANDHRGHGINHTPPDIQGHFDDHDGWRKVIEDAWAVTQELQSQKQLPIILMGHSMGSFIAQTLISEHGAAYRAVILSGTNGHPTIKEGFALALARLECTIRGPRTKSKWIDSQVSRDFNRPFAPNRTRFDWLSRDNAEVDKYICDPLCGFPLTTKAWVDFLEGRQQLARLAKQIPKELPIHFISGSCDPVGEMLRGVNRLLDTYTKLGLTQVTKHFYDGARHELVNETNRDSVTKDLIAWLKTL